MRHLITLFDVTASEIERIFSIAEDLKTKYEKGLREPLQPGRVMGLLFEKPSLRTRVSFEAAMTHLGGTSLFLGKDVGWGERESVRDFGRVLSQYVDVIVCRAGSHEKVVQLAEHCSACSLINGLTDQAHPCQALADLYTLREVHGSLAGRRLAFLGDANNVARSLAVACGKLEMQLAIASPPGYQFDDEFLERLRKDASDSEPIVTSDPAEAVHDAIGVYTDVWASMGQESQSTQRQRDFAPYQVNQALMTQTPKDACFLHCLPAHRGHEVTDEVIDGPQSVVVQQAANRMHVQKGILAWLLGAQS